MAALAWPQTVDLKVAALALNGQVSRFEPFQKLGNKKAHFLKSRAAKQKWRAKGNDARAHPKRAVAQQTNKPNANRDGQTTIINAGKVT